MPTTIESLELEVKQNGSSAVQGIDALSASLTRLKSATKGGMGLTSVANQIRNLSTALNSMDASSTDKINKLANSLEKLKGLGSLKISSSIASQLKNIGNAATNLVGVDFSGISKMSTALAGLNGITKSAGLGSAITQLNKIPELAKTLNSVNWSKFTSNMQRLTDALKPLAAELNTVSAAFSKLPSNLSKVTESTDKVSTSNEKASKSYVNLLSKLTMAVVAVKKVASVIASWITQSNKYVEDLNLFTVALGDGAKEAQDFAEQVSELMGIDPADWLRNQGVFNTIIKGFGVANDKALIMSKNLTQLGYDISSFYNISVEDAFTKLQSGIAGELEPLRRLGYDLSVARLQQEAYNLGINKSVSAMTQAEKSQLRYYAIMTQVTDAQGDMARTLNAPANQLRVLQAQVTQCARSLGNIFIPALNAVLPYAIALAKAIRLVANAIASLFGFSLPEIDYSGLSAGAGAVADAAQDAEDGYGGAAKAAKKLKDNLLGIDELNIIRPDDDSSGGGGGSGVGGGGGFDIDLPEYDFLGGLVESRVDGIVNKIMGYFDELKRKIEESGVIEAFERFKEALSNFAQSDFVKTIEKIIGILADGVITYTLDVIRDTLNLIADILNGDLNRGVNDLKDLLVDITFDPLITIAEVLDTILGTDLAGWFRDVKQELKNLDMTQLPGFEKLQAAIENIKGAFDKLKEALQNFGNMLEETGIADAIKEFVVWLVSTSFDVVLQGIATALNIVADALTIIADILNGDFYSALNDFKNLLATITFEPLETVASIFDSIFGTDIAGWLSNAEKAVKEFDLTGWFGDVGTRIGDFFTKDIPQFWEDVKYAFEHPSFSISTIWENTLQPIKDFDWKTFGYNVGQKVGTAVKEIGNAFKTFFTETLPEVWENVKEAFKTFFTETLPTFFTETLPELWETIKTEFVTFFTETLPEALSNIGEWFLEVGQGIWDGIVEGWNTAIQAISDFIDGLVQGFKDALGIHSPSTVFRDEIGKFLGEGLLEGIAAPFKAIGKWVKKNIIDPISNFIKNNPIADLVVNIKNTASEWWNNVKDWWSENAGDGISIEAFVSLAKKGWSTVKGWIGSIPTLSQAISLIKKGWDTVKNWVGNIPVLSQGIELVKKGWQTVKGWIGNIPTLDQAIQLVKSGWQTVKTWIGNIPVLSQAISLIKSGWTTVKGWIGNIPTLSQAINLIKSGWTTVKAWVGNIPVVSQAINLIKSGWTTVKAWVGNIPVVSQAVNLIKSGWTTVKGWIGNIPVISQGISLFKSGWSSLSSWIGTASSVGISLWKNGWSSISSWIGTSVSVGISLFKSGWSSIKSWFGLANGGILGANGGLKIFTNAGGGIITPNRWQGIPAYASGTNKPHGTMFVAGEAGAEMVGHINGTTEVLNRFQLGQVMNASITNAMALYLPVWRALNSAMIQSANAIIRSVLVSAEAVNATLADQVTYDPTNYLSQSVYEESSNLYSKSRDEGSMAATMRDFYREYVEPTLMEIASDAKRQADKEEQTIVQIGNRTINDAVVTQQKANGYVFAK